MLPAGAPGALNAPPMTDEDQASPALRVGMVVAEPSGDLLAAGLMQALREELPGVRFEGVSGPLMQQVGIDSWESMDSLSVMGLFEVLRHLPRLLRLRGRLRSRWREAPPMVFIGIDAPDFNLGLERRLRETGVPTVHYVSPTVWAWRVGRVKKIRRAVDLLLAIFPFEEEFLARYRIAARYVGHPLAHELPLEPDRRAARRTLQLDKAAPVLALLPGSRQGEVSRIAGPFLQTAAQLRERLPNLRVLVPLVNERTRAMVGRIHSETCPELPLRLSVGDARVAMTAADVLLLASGTATLEGLLCKRPMVVGYRLHPITYQLLRRLKLVKIEQVAMANILAGEELAPERIQQACRPDALLPPLLRFFQDAEIRAGVARRYSAIHEELRVDSNRIAARAVVDLLKERGVV